MDPDLTLADCIARRHSVAAWCGSGCPGRDLDLSKLGNWAGRRIVDLAAEGRFVCSRCGAPAVYVTVSAHMVADPVLRWRAEKPER